MMKIAPLIHSRTFECDFNPNFAVLPNDFNDSDIQWARNKILPATSDLDILNDIRFVVASNHCKHIAGVACILKFFADHYLTTDEQNEAKDFFYDDKGRAVKMFIGYSISGSSISANDIPDINYSDFWKMFKEHLAPVWKRKVSETVKVPYGECKTKRINIVNVNAIDTFNITTLYEASPSNNNKIFEKALSEVTSKEITFCSNVDKMKIVEDGIFTAVTTTTNIIERLADKKKQLSNKLKQDQQQVAPTPHMRQLKSQPRKNMSLLIIGAIVLIILVVILFLLMN